MPITPAQKAAAEQQQWAAAREAARQVRLVAGPGTGKSRTIEKRVHHVLDAGATPENVHVISFTRATCAELRARITEFCAAGPHGPVVGKVSVSTMHALALRILRRANLLNQYPSEPFILDNWEHKNVYDDELSGSLSCNRRRAAEIRRAHDASWQTLNPAEISQARITQTEMDGFNAFHGARTNLYSCVLPGEVIFKCVENLRLGNIQADDLPSIEHLIVDEFQDLNACDQAFVRLLSGSGAVLFIAGDDDQSIYSFRHADPSGIVNFQTTYPAAASHDLTDCFRCAPGVLRPALQLISHNPNRLSKSLNALYGSAAPPVPGHLHVWSFATAQQEARAIAYSCRELIDAGMQGREDEILILLAQLSPASVQLDPLTQELANLGVPFAEPGGAALTEVPALRAVYCVLRLIRDREKGAADYLAHRDLFCLFNRVGSITARRLADDCVARNQNFRELFYQATLPTWLRGRARAAVDSTRALVEAIRGWSLSDTVGQRLADMAAVLGSYVFTAPGQSAEHLATWVDFARNLPQAMTLSELHEYFGTNSSEQLALLDEVRSRLGASGPEQLPSKMVRILTMHGAKGLSGKVVFIPSAAQGIVPNTKSLQAPGLLIEQRRLFYVSVTRAMAACIISHAVEYSGAAAQALAQRSRVRLSRSQFLNEMQAPSVSRANGLTPAEATAIVAAIRDL